ncbi:unnamed protein product, partial [Amoebophrya sp. A120]|eukprot:GSA120T00014541001.1
MLNSTVTSTPTNQFDVVRTPCNKSTCSTRQPSTRKAPLSAASSTAFDDPPLGKNEVLALRTTIASTVAPPTSAGGFTSRQNSMGVVVSKLQPATSSGAISTLVQHTTGAAHAGVEKNKNTTTQKRPLAAGRKKSGASSPHKKED